ncbi:MAG: HAD family phosphatase [Chloroflexi bacterium]|nr:HAD family phosphatase [Chloroflexota bacterium]
MNNEQISTVIFDYGGVLGRTVDHTPRRSLEQRFDLGPDGVYKVVFDSPLWNEAQTGRISNDEFWTDIGQRLGLNMQESTEFRDTFWSGDKLDEELVALIRYLRDEGYHIALLSNAPDSAMQHIKELGIADIFDTIVISAIEGVMKPDAAIFELTLERIDIRADEAVFVDDFRENVAAARQAGLHAVRFRGLAPLRHQLRALGISVPDPVLPPLSDIQAIILDWGGVMEALPDDAGVFEWERRLAVKPGTLWRVLWGKVWRQLSSGTITEADYVARVSEQLGLPDAEAGRHFLEEFHGEDRFYPQMATVIRALQSRYQIALLSNASPGQAGRACEQYGFDIHVEFDVYVNSALVGLRKPDPAIFHLALEQLGVEPQQALFVDDMIYNVDIARELGIPTVQFVDPDTSLAEMEMLLGHSI